MTRTAQKKAERAFEDALTHLPCDGPSKCLYEAHRIDCPSDVVKRLRTAYVRAILLAKLAQAESDMWLAHSDAGCESGRHEEPEISEYERGRLASFNDIQRERDRLRREVERAS